jgi:hypothetical protein
MVGIASTWDGDYAKSSRDGGATPLSVEWIIEWGIWLFGWIMDDRAIQDFSIIRPSTAHHERLIGTTLRYFTTKLGTRSVTFIDPQNSAVITLNGGAVESHQIILHK